MPLIEPESGDVGHGIGGGYASRNNAAFSAGGFGGWRDRDHSAFANGRAGWTACVWKKRTGAVSQVFNPRLAVNSVKAGGGVVAAWTTDDPNNPTNGIWASTGFRKERAGLAAVGPDGAICYVPNYQAGVPFIVRELDGTEWLLTNGPAAAVMLL